MRRTRVIPLYLATRFVAVALVSFIFYKSTITVFFAQEDFAFLWGAQHLTVDGLIQGFVRRNEEGTYVSWRPLSQPVWFWFNLRLWGLSAELFHLSSLVLHALNSVLVVLIARALLKNTTWAAVAGILHGTNPVHFQAVVWPAAPDIFASLLVFISFLAYLQFAASGFTSRRLLWASLLAYAGSLMSKEPSVMLVVVVAAHLAIVHGKTLGEILRSCRFVYAFALLAGLFLVRLVLVGLPPPGPYGMGLGLSTVEGALRYVIWGVGVTTPMLWRLHGMDFKPGAAAVVVAGLTVGILIFVVVARWGRRNPALTFGLAWFFAFLIPVLLVAQRASFYASLPSFGLMLALAHVAMRSSRSRTTTVLIALTLALVLAVRTHALEGEFSSNPVPYMGKLAKQTLINIDRLGGLDNTRILYLISVPEVERWAYGFEWMFRVYYPGIRRVKYLESPAAVPEAHWGRADVTVLSIENSVVKPLSPTPVQRPIP